MSAVIGRERELAVLSGALDAGLHRRAGVLLSGEAGIGKSTLWREAVGLAETAGYRILLSRPAENETALAFAALGDLLDGVGDDVLAALPLVQREALERALLRSAPGADPLHPRVIGVALASVFRTLAAEQPLAIAVDDVQWMDRSSSAALSFALRRSPDSTPLVLLHTLRAEVEAPDSLLALDDRVTVIRLGPLSLSALFHVIQAELGLVLPRPTLQRIASTAGGNPLFAVELARALDEAGYRPRPGEPLPVPEHLHGLLQRRIARLPADAVEALLAVALVRAPTTAALERVLGPGGLPGLERALAAGVVRLLGDSVRFTHPLLASAVMAAALPERRREMHRRLALVAVGEEERVRHLALGSERPDEEVATSLTAAAELALARGAPLEAADLVELGLLFTPPDSAELDRRALQHARLLARAGDAGAANALLDDLLGRDLTDALRAESLELRAQAHYVTGTSVEAEACCVEGLALAGVDEPLRARLLVTFARLAMDPAVESERATAALELLDGMADPDPALVSEALSALAGSLFNLGLGIPAALVDRGLELERRRAPEQVADRFSASLGVWLKYDGDLDGARHWLHATREAALAEGDEGSMPFALSHLPQLELWAGNWREAAELAREHLALAEATGQGQQRFTAIFNLALVESHLGEAFSARGRLEDALAEAEGGDPWNLYLLLSALGFLELTEGRVTAAVGALGQAFAIYEDVGAGDTPSVFENYAEALLLGDDLDTARDVADLFEHRARRARRPMTLAPALRCQALVAEAEGRLADAVALLEEALVHHERVPMPFSQARTRLVLGRVLRRTGARRAARLHLEASLTTLTSLGSPAWAERARAELHRVPIRRATPSDRLSPTEERVAALVAQGRSNREVAASLYVTEKTVEANLTRIYRKLEVTSRAALAARIAADEQRGRTAIT